jgi:hypothetical protein
VTKQELSTKEVRWARYKTFSPSQNPSISIDRSSKGKNTKNSKNRKNSQSCPTHSIHHQKQIKHHKPAGGAGQASHIIQKQTLYTNTFLGAGVRYTQMIMGKQ